jgi:urease accessory protein
LNTSGASLARSTLLLVAGLLLTTTAGAHPGHAAAVDGSAALYAGFAHPWSGFDHLLAMLAVGMWAAQSGQRHSLLALPLLFVATMLGGALLGLGAALAPSLEFVIGTSVVALGALIVLQVRLPLRYAATLVASVACAHGFAHGAELPPATAATGYFVGFATATLSLHALGIVLAVGLARLNRHALPALGAMLAGVGAVLLALS